MICINVFWNYITDPTVDWLQVTYLLTLRHLQQISCWVYDVMSKDTEVMQIMNIEVHLVYPCRVFEWTRLINIVIVIFSLEIVIFRRKSSNHSISFGYYSTLFCNNIPNPTLFYSIGKLKQTFRPYISVDRTSITRYLWTFLGALLPNILI